MTSVVIQQVADFQDVLSPTDTGWDAVLNRICSGFAQGAWSAGGGTIADPWGNRFRINVAGSDLVLSAAGQIQSGTISAITVTDAGGATLATMTSPAWGGLSLYVPSLRAAYRSPEGLDQLVAHWSVTYSAATMPDSGYNGGMGVTFEGARGQDTVTGSRWMDALRGGGGNDWIDGGDGNDLLQGDHTAFLGSDAPAGDDILYGGQGDDQLLGDAGNDRLYGDDGNDSFRGDEWGQQGDDLMEGGLGRDRFWSEAGNDTYRGGSGIDRILIHGAPGAGAMTVNLTTGTATGWGNDRIYEIEVVEGALENVNILTGAAASDRLIGGFESDTLSGQGGHDRLWGDWGSDIIHGGTGNDTLGGDGGLDTLFGGSGSDLFYFTDAAGDRVRDFAAVDDQVALQSGTFGLTGTGALLTSRFKDLASGAVDADDRVIYHRDTGRLWIDSNGSAAGERVLLAQFLPGTALTAADILLRPQWDRDDFML